MRKDFENSLIETIKLVERIIPNWFMVGGACLGHVRNKQFIEHDSDVDIGIYASKEKVKELVANLPVLKKYYYNSHLLEVKLFFDCNVDVFFLFNYNHEIAEAVFAEAINRVRFYTYPPCIFEDGVIQSSLNGIKVNVLKRSREYCEHIYGKDYLIEKKDWNSWSDPFNIKFEGAIIEDTYIKSIPSLNNQNYSEALKLYIKAFFQLISCRNIFTKSLEPSLYNGLTGCVLFLFCYARQFEDTVSNNLASQLLSGINQLLSNDKIDYTDGLIGYGMFLSILSKNDFIEIEEDLFEAINNAAIRFVKEYQDDNDPIQLLGASNYILNCIKNESTTFHEILHSLQRHTYLLNIKTCDQFEHWMDDVNLSAEEQLLLAKTIILLSKVNQQKKIDSTNEFLILQKNSQEKLKQILKNYLNTDTNFSYVILYAISEYLGTENENFIKNAFDKTDFLKQSYQDDICFFIHNAESFIRISHLQSLNISADISLHHEINKRFFKNGVFNYEPYRNFDSIDDPKLYGGLSGLGMLLFSLLTKNTEHLNWDSLLLLS
jgi:hypothetical protein